MSARDLQRALIHLAADCLEIDCTAEGETSQGQFALLFSKREATAIIAYLYKHRDWAPVIISFDSNLFPSARGMEWIATDWPA